MDSFLHDRDLRHEKVKEREIHLFLNKQSIFDPRPENCLSFSKKSPQKIV